MSFATHFLVFSFISGIIYIGILDVTASVALNFWRIECSLLVVLSYKCF